LVLNAAKVFGAFGRKGKNAATISCFAATISCFLETCGCFGGGGLKILHYHG
jgi:hypothetical protein